LGGLLVLLVFVFSVVHSTMVGGADQGIGHTLHVFDKVSKYAVGDELDRRGRYGREDTGKLIAFAT